MNRLIFDLELYEAAPNTFGEDTIKLINNSSKYRIDFNKKNKEICYIKDTIDCFKYITVEYIGDALRFTDIDANTFSFSPYSYSYHNDNIISHSEMLTLINLIFEYHC